MKAMSGLWIAAIGAALLVSGAMPAAAEKPKKSFIVKTTPKAVNKSVIVKTKPVSGHKVVVVKKKHYGNKGVGIAVGVAAATAAAVIMSQESKAGYYSDRPSKWQCRKWDEKCDDGSDWACRKLDRECDFDY